MSDLMVKLSDAVHDLRYLLDQGYPRDSAVNFVANHYRLPLNQRHLLARCVFSKAEIANHRAKAVSIAKVRGKRLGIDGYNVLITVESILTGKQVIRCDDGFVRDMRAIFGKYRITPATTRALKAIGRVIAKAGPSYVTVLFDKQVSRSGELAAETRRILKQAKVKVDTRAIAEVDRELRAFNVVASSDRAVIKRAKAVWDISGEILKQRAANVLDLTKLPS